MTKETSADIKRSVARRFNDVLAPAVKQVPKTLDLRTQRRLERYRKELRDGLTGSKPLTPLDVAMRVDELLTHGEKLSKIRDMITPRQVELDHESVVALLKEMHPMYGYRPAAYRFAGVTDEALFAAGIIQRVPNKRGPKPKQK